MPCARIGKEKEIHRGSSPTVREGFARRPSEPSLTVGLLPRWIRILPNPFPSR